MPTLTQLLGVSVEAFVHKQEIEALEARWQPLIDLVAPVTAIYQADPKLVADTLALARAIAPAYFAPKVYTAQWVQTSLNSVMGSKLAVDGIIDGPETKAVVRSFQTRVGLTVDGWAGGQTCAALDIQVRAFERLR